MSEYIYFTIFQIECQIKCQNRCQKGMPDKINKMSEYTSDRMPGKTPDRMSEYMPEKCQNI